MSIAQEALASVFASQLLDNLFPRLLDKLGVSDCKGREANDREQSRVNLFGVRFSWEGRVQCGVVASNFVWQYVNDLSDRLNIVIKSLEKVHQLNCI